MTRTSRPGIERARDRVLVNGASESCGHPSKNCPRPCARSTNFACSAQRGGEVAAWQQDVDLESGWWTIPSSGSKESSGTPSSAQRFCALAIVAEG